MTDNSEELEDLDTFIPPETPASLEAFIEKRDGLTTDEIKRLEAEKYTPRQRKQIDKTREFIMAEGVEKITNDIAHLKQTSGLDSEEK